MSTAHQQIEARAYEVRAGPEQAKATWREDLLSFDADQTTMLQGLENLRAVIHRHGELLEEHRKRMLELSEADRDDGTAGRRSHLNVGLSPDQVEGFALLRSWATGQVGAREHRDFRSRHRMLVALMSSLETVAREAVSDEYDEGA